MWEGWEEELVSGGSRLPAQSRGGWIVWAWFLWGELKCWPGGSSHGVLWG